MMGPGRGPYPLSSFVDVGGLVSFNPNIEVTWLRAGIYGDNPSAVSTQYLLHALRSLNGTEPEYEHVRFDGGDQGSSRPRLNVAQTSRLTVRPEGANQQWRKIPSG